MLVLLLVTTRLSYFAYNLENNVSIILESGLVVVFFYPSEDDML